MLNRRIIRVKAMQALYGYFTAVESTIKLKKNELEEIYTLNPEKHDFAAKSTFDTNKKQAIELFNKNLLNRKVEQSKEDDEIIKNVNAILLDFDVLIQKEARTRKSEMIKEVARQQKIYLKFLILPIEIEQREKLEKEKDDNAQIPKEKKNYPFINNELVKKIKTSKILEKEIQKSNISWSVENSEIKSWYHDQIRTAEALQFFYAKKGEAPQNDIVLELFRHVIFKKNKSINNHFEKNYLHWFENQSIIQSMILKTIKALQEGKSLEFAELSKNNEDNSKFLETLFVNVIEHNNYLETLIQSKTQNWDINRIALIDKIILKLALVEMINFPSIPSKVTMNEAIEISKTYSTPKSSQFVNGILNILLNELTSSGEIRKSGKGLIDNK